MRVRGALQVAALLASALWATPLLAKKDRPTFHTKALENIPKYLSYFPDSDVILFQDTEDKNVYRSEDAGEKWERVDAVPEGKASLLYMHEFDPKRAYILTASTHHYRTSDRGKTWEKWDSEVLPDEFRGDLLQFHATDPDRIIFNGMTCRGMDCWELAMYTTDGFKSPAKLLRKNTDGCWWAKGSDLFTTAEDDLDKNRILCIVQDSFSSQKQDKRLQISDNFFKGTEEAQNIQEFEPNLDGDKTVRGIVSVATVKGYLLVATTSDNTDEMALFVTKDTKKWHRAVFPAAHDSHDHRLQQEAYTVLESTNYSIQIDVLTSRPSNPMGVIFTSNSDGTYFTENVEHTNRNKRGHVDFEKIAGIQGVFLVNKVKNWKDVEKKSNTKKKVVSEITFDDGRTFEKITAKGDDVHLHSVTELSNMGRVYSSAAPGIVMGIGNTGDYLEDYWKDGNLFVSDDAGKTWTKALDGPHKYEFGDQGSILVAIKDSQEADVSEIRYSLDHGQNWKTESLPNDLKIRPYILTTTPDSTSLKFILIGKTDQSPTWQVISLDFEGLHESTCKESDMEVWSARTDQDGKATCLMGHTQSFHRRKKDAECFLKQEFKHAVAETKNCPCTEQDYECDFNFERDGDGKCVQRGPIVPPKDACRNAKPDDTFKGSSGYRKIPGNTCEDTKELKDKYKDVDRKCSDAIGGKPAVPITDKVKQNETVFDDKDWDSFEKHYLERGDSSSADDETVIMRPWKGNNKPGPIYFTDNQGDKWDTRKQLDGEDILAIIPHTYFKDMVFFITKGKKVYYTQNRGGSIHEFEAPTKPDTEVLPLAFHPDRKDWFLWTGKKCDGDECYRVASFTTDRGDNWKTAARYVRRCEFTGSSAYKFPDRKEEQILCLKHEKEDNNKPLVIVSTNDWFKNEETHGKNVKDFATMAEFIVVAAEDEEKKTLQASASLDGKVFAEARFPYGFTVTHQHAYTVLDSSTHAVNLFVATEMQEGRTFGTIIKSNSNGTSYVVSVRNVNCNDEFYVDFEKMLGLEGVALVNVVANPDEKKGSKKLQTKITHNDGAQWAYLAPPADDEFGKFPCHSSEGNEKCALHIHGYTERANRGKTHSSQSAVGFMFGLGNVGDSLSPQKEADTFMTSDAGVTWKRVRQGQWTWAIGDQGGVMVLAQTTKKSKTIWYSIDQGATWKEHEFSSSEVEVWDITTMRSGGSRTFLLWGKNAKGAFTLKLDFEGFFGSDVCKYDKDLSKSDYNLFTPKHPMQQDGCLFGHVSQYLRKKPEAKCITDAKLQPVYGKQNCTCGRQDFECDYNFELDKIGQCSLIPGFTPRPAEQWCVDHPDAYEYWEPTGYRRVPLTTCVGGQEFDKQSGPSYVCDGHEEEYEKAHRRSGVAVFFAVVIPFALAGAAGWYVWRNWNGKFGQIRLGDQGTSAFDSDQPWVKYPVVALSAVVAVLGAIPLVAAALWRTARGAAERFGWGGGGRGSWSRLSGAERRFTTRDSFARGSSDYDIVGEDEGELLGDESDDEQV